MYSCDPRVTFCLVYQSDGKEAECRGDKKGSRYIGQTPFRGPSSWAGLIRPNSARHSIDLGGLVGPGEKSVKDSFRRGEALGGNEAKEVCEVPADEVLQRGEV